MSELVQNVIVVIVVIAAAGFLVARRVRAKRRATPFCENCPGCGPGPAAPAEPGLLNIGEPTRRP